MMNLRILILCALLLGSGFESPVIAQSQTGQIVAEAPVQMFDGKTLDGWDADPKFWTVEDGAITGRTTKENPTKGNTFCIWKGGEAGDFELNLEFRIEAHNSGCLLYTSPSPRDATLSRMPSSA